MAPFLVMLVLAALPAAGQYTRYSEPGRLGERRTLARDEVMEAYQNARWKAGPVELEPRLVITDVGYVSNVFFSAEEQSESDFKAQASAGLRAFFNLGPEVVVSPFADLTYSWWQEQQDLRSLNESFGLQLFGDFNRLQLQLQAGRVASQGNLSSEVEVPVDQRDDRIEFGFDIDLRGPLRLFGSAATGEVRYSGSAAETQVPGLSLATLDVDSELLQGGIAYEFGNELIIGLGVERREAEFRVDPAGRSSRGTGPLVRVDFDGSRLFLDLDAAFLDLEFVGRPGDDRRQVDGLGQVGWRLSEKLTAGLYGAVRLQSSALDAGTIFETRRRGVSLERAPSPRYRLRLFYEVGADEFGSVASEVVTRIDDFTSYGLTLDLQLTPRLRIDLGFFDTSRDSSDPAFNRDFQSFGSRVRLGGNLLPW